jgi:hypothetical protein
MSIKIGDFEIPEKYGAFIYPYMGGIFVRVSILGEQPILRNLDSLKEGEVYEMESNKGNGIRKIKKVNKIQKTVGQKVIYEYDIDFEVMG